ncbi:nuclear transport factor 2 family protein [Pseudoflavitalea sp. X16]|uniref:nuclear transport factor 2 family protein n=1 Tax=Paraflavitalea devenefica TaxID=2716334 RepID=UPI00141DEDB7|nr:nuclear transport factor 2 family protein [Paraflavitalea devenefica]NII25648.1 nuclear transport factor 2 family protein [Paraflavitalea devenefica]
MHTITIRLEWLKQSSLALLIAMLFTTTPLILLSQTITEENGVKACLENYMSGDGNRMEKAFHPSATMKYIDYQSGEFKDVPIADFIARIKSNTTKTDRKIEIVSMNIEGSAAQAKIRIETAQVIMNDYMNLLKINGEWKIVSKIFSRQNK